MTDITRTAYNDEIRGIAANLAAEALADNDWDRDAIGDKTMTTYFKPDPSLIAAIRAAVQRHKLTSNATLARRVVAARTVA